jgi:hypothetical protein
MRPVASKEDRFTLRLWTVGWLGRRLDQLAMEHLLSAGQPGR